MLRLLKHVETGAINTRDRTHTRAYSQVSETSRFTEGAEPMSVLECRIDEI